jgi:hypothetical protein
MREVPSGLSTRAIRLWFRSALSSFPGHDTEDRERLCRYIEQLVGILEIEKPRRFLTRWLYGPFLGTLVLLANRRQEPTKGTA